MQSYTSFFCALSLLTRPKIWSLAQTATSDASSLAGRLYPEWYFQSNNMADNLLLNSSFPESYNHHVHHHHHHHQAAAAAAAANSYASTAFRNAAINGLHPYAAASYEAAAAAAAAAANSSSR